MIDNNYRAHMYFEVLAENDAQTGYLYRRLSGLDRPRIAWGFRRGEFWFRCEGELEDDDLEPLICILGDFLAATECKEHITWIVCWIPLQLESDYYPLAACYVVSAEGYRTELLTDGLLSYANAQWRSLPPMPPF